MSVGLVIAKVRKRKRMTLRDLEGVTGVSNVTISKIERGSIRDPGFRTVCQIARALGIAVTRLAKAAGP